MSLFSQINSLTERWRYEVQWYKSHLPMNATVIVYSKPRHFSIDVATWTNQMEWEKIEVNATNYICVFVIVVGLQIFYSVRNSVQLFRSTPNERTEIVATPVIMILLPP